METAPQIGTHNACASGKTTGEGNRIRFPKQIQGDARVAEHAVGMTENCAVFRAECVKKLLQFFRADLPVNSLFQCESVLVEQQPRKRIIVRIVTRKRRDRKRFRLAADQLRSLFCGNAKRLCNLIRRKLLLLVQPLHLLHTLHFILGQCYNADVRLQIAIHLPAQKRMQICGQFSAILVIHPGGKTLTKFQSTFGTQFIQRFFVRTAKALRCVLCNRSNEPLHLQVEFFKGFCVAAEILPVQFFIRHALSPPCRASSFLFSWTANRLAFALYTAERIEIPGCQGFVEGFIGHTGLRSRFVIKLLCLCAQAHLFLCRDNAAGFILVNALIASRKCLRQWTVRRCFFDAARSITELRTGIARVIRIRGIAVFCVIALLQQKEPAAQFALPNQMSGFQSFIEIQLQKRLQMLCFVVFKNPELPRIRC